MTTKTVKLPKEELKKKIIEEKLKGILDLEIGKKYSVSFKFIEKIVTQFQGINISDLSKLKEVKKNKNILSKKF